MGGRKVWVADDVLAAADLNEFVGDQVVMVFATAAARAGAILAPVEGMLTYREDANIFEFWNGSAWVEVNADNAKRVSGQTIFIQEAEPAATAVNDLWFF
jgi:hypothetical protein